MAKLKFKKFSYDVILVTLSLLRHQKRHQTNVKRFFNFGSLPIKISGYAIALLSHFMVLISLNIYVPIVYKVEAHLPYFFAWPMGRVVADRALQS